MPTSYKIHPAIGVARVGNSPDEFFIGPELLGQPPEPPGGFKDAQCRVKRQAARFRIFAHHDDGSVEAITEEHAEITWTAHLVNSKAANPGRGDTEAAADLTIDPGPRTLTGPNQQQRFDTGTIRFAGAPVTTVPLGEIRSTPENYLLVLGGAGHAASPAGTALDGFFWASDDWYDDVSDGPVTATITFRSDNSSPPVMGAWVMRAAEVRSAPGQSHHAVRPRVQAMVGGRPARPDDHLLHARHLSDSATCPRHRWGRTDAGFAHVGGSRAGGAGTQSDLSSLEGAQRRRASPRNMPRLRDSGTADDRLTRVQYDHMQRWLANNPAYYTDDWTGVPPPQTEVTPDGLDRAALQTCVGGAFFPGIEAGGLRPPHRSTPVRSSTTRTTSNHFDSTTPHSLRARSLT